MMRNNASDILNDKIVDAYFSTNPKIGTSRRKSTSKSALPVLAVSVSLMLTFLSLHLGNRVYQNSLSRPNRNEPSTSYSKLIETGVIDRAYIKRLSFEGDAKAKSAILNDSVMLVNEGSLNWASLNLEFNAPADFKNCFLFIKGRTETGTKYIDLILSDSQNKSYRVNKVSFSPSGGLNNVPFEKESSSKIDLSSVSKVRLEFGTATAGNAQGTVLYIKDIILRR